MLASLLLSNPEATIASQRVPLGDSAGAFGHVADRLGKGVGGLTVTATDADGSVLGTAVCPSSDNGRAPGSRGTCNATGFWVITGLPPSTSVTFTVSGFGLLAHNVRPNASLTRVTGTSETWIDVNWTTIFAYLPGGAIPVFNPEGAAIQGTVTDARGAAVTGPGAFVILASARSSRPMASTVLAGTTPAVSTGPFAGFGPDGPGQWFGTVLAAPLDAHGHYCFGWPAPLSPDADCRIDLAPGVVGALAQRGLPPDSYLMTVVDGRPTSDCHQSPDGQEPVAACGNVPWTSQPVVAAPNTVTTLDVVLPTRSVQTDLAESEHALPSGSSGVLGVLTDGGVPGGRAVESDAVYAVPVACPAPGDCPDGTPRLGIPPGGAANALVAGGESLLVALRDLTQTIQLDGPDAPAGTLRAVPADPEAPIAEVPGLFRIPGLVPGVTYAVIAEAPPGYSECGPNNIAVQSSSPSAPPDSPPPLSPTLRCATLVTAPSAGAWAAGADFVFLGQTP